uniref:Uncharacterized protein n=2 Tax=Romanomermis culicivorax TaxID=13658 RepID=A0A915KBM9_ROMCU
MISLNFVAARHLKKPSDFRCLCAQIFTGRFRDENLIDKLTEWLTQNIDICKTDDLIAYLSMCAKCNVEKIPERLIDDIKKKIEIGKIADKQTSLEYVWSLAVLKKMDKALGDRILNGDFVESVCKQGTEHRNTITKLKILNICAAMRYDLKIDSFKDYGKLEPFMDNLKIVPRKHKIAAIGTFLESLHLLAPKETYVETSRISPLGYMIDARIYLSKENKPVPIADQNKDLSTIPTVFLVFDRADYTQLSYRLTGLNSMAVRHLTSSGFRVIQVSGAEFSKKATVIDRVNYVKLLIDNYSTSDLDALDARS